MSAWTPIEAQATSPINLGTYISLLFFDSFFGIMALYYHHRAIIIDADGVIVQGAISIRNYAWHDVLEIVADPGYIPGYVVHTRRGSFGLLKLEFPQHQRIAHLIQENCRRRTFPKTQQLPTSEPSSEPIVNGESRRVRRFGRRKTRNTP